MKVRELIEALRKCPSEMNVVVWDAEEDDNVPVTHALWEDGCIEIQIGTGEVPVMVPVDSNDTGGEG